ncbi:DUF4157 domain-containing protein [Streptomyces sp. NPDC051016]|uniref:DUF4157 domain-containing protein n=1 Tax=Streptomyces sp. NPDC051016 TaxID=3365638 RepID=UPI0037AF484D
MREQQSGERQDRGRRQSPSVPPPVGTTAQRMLALQRRAGNAAVARAVEEERHEHDAGCGHAQQDTPVQRRAVLGVLGTPGRPVDSAIRAKAEQGMGTDFSDVVMHTGPEAEASAAEFGARAYTSGRHIVVGAGGADEHTMLHELAHAWQQQKGPVEGTDTGAGVRLSDPSDRHEQEADSIAHRIRSGGSAVAPTAAQSPAAATGTGAVPVARMPRGGNSSSGGGGGGSGGSRMHPADAGQLFEILVNGRQEVGRYVRVRSNGREVFDTERLGRVEIRPSNVLGPRARVGGIHPPGQRRPAEENLADRSQVYLSEADGSAARARLRRDPRAADDIAITTFEPEPEQDYETYDRNREDLRRLGVPVLNDMDLSREDSAQRLQHVGPEANLHFQMPRVPRGTRGYSTQQLVRDTNRLPERMGRNDVSVSITTPRPEQYARPGVHNSFYGLENRNAVPPGMRVVRAGHDPDENLEEYGYQHRISGKNKSADVAGRRKTYYIESDRRSNSPEEYEEPRDYRDREEADERRARSRSRRRRTSEYDDPRGRSRSRSRPAPAAAPEVYDDEELYAAPPPRERSRSRSRSVRRAERGRSRPPVTLTQADLDNYVEYGGGDYEEEQARSHRARSQSRAARRRSRSRYAAERNYAAPSSQYDEPVSSQQVRDEDYETDYTRVRPRASRRRRTVILDSDDEW